MHWRRKWQPTPVFLPGESQGRWSLMGCSLWGCTESDTTEVTAASAAPFHCLPYVLYLFIWEWAFRLSPVCLVTQLCLTLCDPKDCSPPASAVHGDSSGKNNGVGCHALLKGIFPTQGSNPGLAHCRQILYHLSHQGSPRILEAHNSKESFQPRN